VEPSHTNRAAAETAITLLIHEINVRLEQAVAIGKGAQACAERGHIAKSVAVAFDIDKLCQEASRLLVAADRINWISAGGQPIPESRD